MTKERSILCSFLWIVSLLGLLLSQPTNYYVSSHSTKIISFAAAVGVQQSDYCNCTAYNERLEPEGCSQYVGCTYNNSVTLRIPTGSIENPVSIVFRDGSVENSQFLIVVDANGRAEGIRLAVIKMTFISSQIRMPGVLPIGSSITIANNNFSHSDPSSIITSQYGFTSFILIVSVQGRESTFVLAGSVLSITNNSFNVRINSATITLLPIYAIAMIPAAMSNNSTLNISGNRVLNSVYDGNLSVVAVVSVPASADPRTFKIASNSAVSMSGNEIYQSLISLGASVVRLNSFDSTQQSDFTALVDGNSSLTLSNNKITQSTLAGYSSVICMEFNSFIFSTTDSSSVVISDNSIQDSFISESDPEVHCILLKATVAVAKIEVQEESVFSINNNSILLSTVPSLANAFYIWANHLLNMSVSGHSTMTVDGNSIALLSGSVKTIHGVAIEAAGGIIWSASQSSLISMSSNTVSQVSGSSITARAASILSSTVVTLLAEYNSTIACIGNRIFNVQLMNAFVLIIRAEASIIIFIETNSSVIVANNSIAGITSIAASATACLFLATGDLILTVATVSRLRASYNEVVSCVGFNLFAAAVLFRAASHSLKVVGLSILEASFNKIDRIGSSPETIALNFYSGGNGILLLCSNKSMITSESNTVTNSSSATLGAVQFEANTAVTIIVGNGSSFRISWNKIEHSQSTTSTCFRISGISLSLLLDRMATVNVSNNGIRDSTFGSTSATISWFSQTWLINANDRSSIIFDSNYHSNISRATSVFVLDLDIGRGGGVITVASNSSLLITNNIANQVAASQGNLLARAIRWFSTGQVSCQCTANSLFSISNNELQNIAGLLIGVAIINIYGTLDISVTENSTFAIQENRVTQTTASDLFAVRLRATLFSGVLDQSSRLILSGNAITNANSSGSLEVISLNAPSTLLDVSNKSEIQVDGNYISNATAELSVTVVALTWGTLVSYFSLANVLIRNNRIYFSSSSGVTYAVCWGPCNSSSDSTSTFTQQSNFTISGTIINDVKSASTLCGVFVGSANVTTADSKISVNNASISNSRARIILSVKFLIMETLTVSGGALVLFNNSMNNNDASYLSISEWKVRVLSIYSLFHIGNCSVQHINREPYDTEVYILRLISIDNTSAMRLYFTSQLIITGNTLTIQHQNASALGYVALTRLDAPINLGLGSSLTMHDNSVNCTNFWPQLPFIFFEKPIMFNGIGARSWTLAHNDFFSTFLSYSQPLDRSICRPPTIMVTSVSGVAISGVTMTIEHNNILNTFNSGTQSCAWVEIKSLTRVMKVVLRANIVVSYGGWSTIVLGNFVPQNSNMFLIQVTDNRITGVSSLPTGNIVRPFLQLNISATQFPVGNIIIARNVISASNTYLANVSAVLLQVNTLAAFRNITVNACENNIFGTKIRFPSPLIQPNGIAGANLIPCKVSNSRSSTIPSTATNLYKSASKSKSIQPTLEEPIKLLAPVPAATTASLTVVASAIGGATAAVDAQTMAVIGLVSCAGGQKGKSDRNYRSLSIVALDDTCEGVLIGNTIVVLAAAFLSAVGVSVTKIILSKRHLKAVSDAKIQGQPVPVPPTLAVACGMARAPHLWISLCLYLMNSFAVCGIELARGDGSQGKKGGAGVAFAVPLLLVLSFPVITYLFGSRRLLPVRYLWRPKPLSMVGSTVFQSWALDPDVGSDKLFGCVFGGMRRIGCLWPLVPQISFVATLPVILATTESDNCGPLFTLSALLFFVGAMFVLALRPRRVLASDLLHCATLVVNGLTTSMAAVLLATPGDTSATLTLDHLGTAMTVLTAIRITHSVAMILLGVLVRLGKANGVCVGNGSEKELPLDLAVDRVHVDDDDLEMDLVEPMLPLSPINNDSTLATYSDQPFSLHRGKSISKIVPMLLAKWLSTGSPEYQGLWWPLTPQSSRKSKQALTAQSETIVDTLLSQLVGATLFTDSDRESSKSSALLPTPPNPTASVEPLPPVSLLASRLADYHRSQQLEPECDQDRYLGEEDKFRKGIARDIAEREIYSLTKQKH